MKKIILLLCLSTSLIINAQTTRTVASESEFNTALNQSSSGDIIEWANGTYSDVYMDVDVVGVTVKAETSGGVVFNGASRVLLDVNDITFTGMQFVGGDIFVESAGTVENTVITVDGSNVVVSHINISEYICKKYFRIRDSSQNTEVTYCNFENRLNYTDQNIFQIDVNSSKSGYHNVNHCSFKDFSGNTSGGDDGVEPIRIGSSDQASYSSKSVIEYCYFTGCDGDGEIISHKASDCVYRYNTFENNTKAELVLRHGDRGIVYGNFFINGMGGIRVQEGSNHIIYNNYFSGLTSRSLNLNASSADKLDNILIAYNTFVENSGVDIENHSTDEATNITLANNLFANPVSSKSLFEDVTGGETWIGNIYSGTLGITTPTSGLSSDDPELSLNTDGYYSIASTSPVIDSAVSGYPTLPTFTDLDYDNEISFDVLVNNRPELETAKDVGSQEYDALVVLKPHATEQNTGPDYDIATLSTNDSEELISQNFSFYPNPLEDDIVNVNFTIKEEANVNVSVYSLTGEKITTIIDSVYSLGSYEVSERVNLSTGIYALKIELSTGVTTAVKVEKLIKK